MKAPARQAANDGHITCRPPAVADGPEIWRLVNNIDTLDTNSAYCYLVLCRHFSNTCAIAECDGRLVGFTTGYLVPGMDTTLYIWQIGIGREFRGRGIATHLIMEILRRDACRSVRYLEATVSPSNTASAALFNSLAHRLGAECETGTCFDTALFPGKAHEDENLLRIGPFGWAAVHALKNTEQNQGREVQITR